LLKLAEVGNVAVLVDASMQKPSAAALSAPPRDQDKIELSLDRLPINESLH